MSPITVASVGRALFTVSLSSAHSLRSLRAESFVRVQRPAQELSLY